MADNSTKLIIGIVIILAIVGIVFLMKEGSYTYKLASRETPGAYGWTGECCTCTRAQTTLRGAVLPQTTEVLFRNAYVADCVAVCEQTHAETKAAGVKYALMSIISNDAECRTSLPVPRTYAGAGGFNDQPMQDKYYIR
ncbi:MAG: hypothetical protein QXR48_03345 [Candidatus Woesearchaeota archaeon]